MYFKYFLVLANWLETKKLWAEVILTPDDSNTSVFNRGVPKGFIGLIKRGGHVWPISMLGPKKKWKNDQKKDIKKSTSDRININIPSFSPATTEILWCPSVAFSRSASFHHKNIITITNLFRGINFKVILEFKKKLRLSISENN